MVLVQVSKPTDISELLAENVGDCHWAACASIFGHENENVIHHTEGIFKKESNKFYQLQDDDSWSELLEDNASEDTRSITKPYGIEQSALEKALINDINPDKVINGRKIINSDLAGTIVKTKGGDVAFDTDGFPDFTPYSQKTVSVEGLTGDMLNDVPLAMEKAGIEVYDKTKYVWHHHQDAKTMMLIPKSVHSVRNGGVAHTGGRAVIKHNKDNPNNVLNYKSPKELV